jgi:hypothetical protein
MTDMIPYNPHAIIVEVGSGVGGYLERYIRETGLAPDTILISKSGLWPLDDENRTFNRYIEQYYKQVHISITETFEIIILERR